MCVCFSNQCYLVNQKQPLAELPSSHSPGSEVGAGSRGCGGRGGWRCCEDCLNVKTWKREPRSLEGTSGVPGMGKPHSSPGVTTANHLGEIWDPEEFPQ